MSDGTLYIHTKSPRSLWLPAYTKALGLNFDYVDVKSDAKILEDFPLGKGPSLKTASGVKLTEAIAIAVYLASLAKSELAGSSEEEKAHVLQWFSFVNSDVSNAGYGGLFASSDEEKASKLATLEKLLNHVDSHLKDSKFLAGDKYTVADFFAVQTIGFFLQAYSLGEKYNNVQRWIKEFKEAVPETE